MNNSGVINELKKIVTQIRKRRDELEREIDRLPPPIETLIERQRQLDERIAAINSRIRHLKHRIRERELARDIGTTVKPISQARADRLKAALEKVSKPISTTNTFKNMISLARQIAEAGSKAGEASVLS